MAVIAPKCLMELFDAAEYLVVADEAMMRVCPGVVSPERRRRSNMLRAMITHVREANGRTSVRLEPRDKR